MTQAVLLRKPHVRIGRPAAFVAAAFLVYAAGGFAGRHDIFPFSLIQPVRAYFTQTPDLSEDLYIFDRRGPLASGKDKIAVACPQQSERTAVLLLLGQSNAGNHGGQPFGSDSGDKIVNFSNGHCFIAHSPLLGADGIGGEYWTRLGELLVERGTFDRVLLAPASITGSEVARWAPGGDLNSIAADAVGSLQGSGYRITHVLWHQGEADYVLGTSEAAYRSRFLSLIDWLRSRQVAAPVFVSVASKCLSRLNGGKEVHVADNPITRAQRALPSARAGVRPGIDTDRLLDELDRQDGCHFSGSGEEKVARAWLNLLSGSP